MQRIQFIIFINLVFFLNLARAQQSYSGSSSTDCDNPIVPPSTAYLYTCNGESRSCNTFVIFNSRPEYNSVSSISTHFSSDPTELARINGVHRTADMFPSNKEVIVPVNCSCAGQYYQANASYKIDNNDTYYSIATEVYSVLGSCSALIGENPYEADDLYVGLRVLVPIRCACPTRSQMKDGTRFLVTYRIWENDSIFDLSTRFNASLEKMMLANGFSVQDNPVIDFDTTILIPLLEEPSSNLTTIHSPIIYPPPIPLTPETPAVVPRKLDSRIQIPVGIGAAVGFLLALFVCVVAGVIVYKKRMRGGKGKMKFILPKDVLVTRADVDHELKVFVYEELKEATNDFGPESRIGGTVYKGVVQGTTVAIKEVSRDVSKEVSILHKVNHFNLITLSGVSTGIEHCYLVYEFMENGSLADWLHVRGRPGQRSWARRVQIALDVAHGLHYLHKFAEPPYVHKDIKSSNILLNRSLRAKIANFSLARSSCPPSAVTKNVEGTLGYMAPEYLESGLVTPKLDVFAFGVVLLELITGKDAIIVHEGRERLLSAVVVAVMEGGSAVDVDGELGRVMDPRIRGLCPMNLAVKMAGLGVSCLRQDPTCRPEMDEVVSSLSKIQRDA